MKKLEPDCLWDMFHIGDGPKFQRPFEVFSGKVEHYDYSLKYMLLAHGWRLKSVIISNDIEHFEHFSDLDYLKASCVIIDPKGEEFSIDFYPEKTGNEDEWMMLMLDTKCDDLVIRFSSDFDELCPLERGPYWAAAVVNGEDIILHGRQILWFNIWEEDNLWQENAPASYFDDLEIYDLTAEAFDPDYTLEDNPYRDICY